VAYLLKPVIEDRLRTVVSRIEQGSLLLTMKDAQGSEIQVSERQAKAVRELLQM
jgi:DNA-binding LytR/AlgR family response regulator